ncbi:MAG: hypothetical protein PHN75_13515 [Syntrophales bacterium]|nr:hypothetical protein [Syntrophales bacterium]
MHFKKTVPKVGTFVNAIEIVYVLDIIDILLMPELWWRKNYLPTSPSVSILHSLTADFRTVRRVSLGALH